MFRYHQITSAYIKNSFVLFIFSRSMDECGVVKVFGVVLLLLGLLLPAEAGIDNIGICNMLLISPSHGKGLKNLMNVFPQ